MEVIKFDRILSVNSEIQVQKYYMITAPKNKAKTWEAIEFNPTWLGKSLVFFNFNFIKVLNG